MDFASRAVEHTGITVSDLGRATDFWVNTLGFTLARQGHLTGEFAAGVTGVTGADISIAVVVAPGGHRVELLQYNEPKDRLVLRPRPCDVGSVHLALTVDDIDAVFETVTRAGWEAARPPQTMTEGPRAGTRFAYMRDMQDGTVLELIQPAATSAAWAQ
ncbi:VOC family protein [Streptomyces griseoviridis]